MDVRRLFAWLRGLFGARSPGPRSDAVPAAGDAATRAHAAAPRTASAGAGRRRGPLRSVLNLDAPTGASFARMADAERELLQRIKARIDAADFELPQLPSTALTAMSMANQPSADMQEVAEVIGSDPVLSSEVLKQANSAINAGSVSVDTLHQAVVRIGGRSLRSLILSLSMRGAVIRCKSLKHYAEEVWRQAYSIARIAREIAPFVGMDAERAFLIGLLHDIGKVSLLRMLSDEMRGISDLASPLVGRLFLVYHEMAGVEMARAWKLPDELVSVAGCHHRFAENPDFPRSAALASVAHKLDLFLSLGAELEFRQVATSEEMEFLQLSQSARNKMLEAARGVFAEVHAGARDAAA